MNTTGSLVTKIVVLAAVLVQACQQEPTLTWTEAEGYRWADLSVSGSGDQRFRALPGTETGITFQNSVTEDQIRDNRIYLNGSGVAIGDVDNDGLSDLYFCRLDGPNVLYKNLGDWKFRDVTDSAGVACDGLFAAGSVLSDIDGDEDLDLLVSSVGGPQKCFLNDGRGRFTDFTEEAGISSETGATTMALADIEGDGDLDLYLTNYKNKSAKDIWEPGALLFEFVVEKIGETHRIAPQFQDHFVLDIRGEWVLFFETGESDILYLNDGTGQFQKVSLTEGRFLDEDGEPVLELRDWGLMARFQDMDDDGDPDLYVCNDFESPDRIWINNGDGVFQAIPPLAIRNTSNSSMAVDFSDIDRDGDEDFLVVDMLSRYHHRRMEQKNTEVPLPHPIGKLANRPQYMKNTLFLNQGESTYSEIGQFSGIHASDWSWSNLFTDVDLDGYEDVLVVTGHYYDAQNFDAMSRAQSRIKTSALSLKMTPSKSFKPSGNDKLSTVFLFPRLELRNIAFRNRGDLTFEEVGEEWGFNSKDISHGIALGDLDNDGDLDAVINRLGSPAAVYRNEATEPRVGVRLKGQPPNTQAIGAKIRVLGGPVPQSKEVIAGGIYLSSSDQQFTFAAGEAKRLTIEVRWRNGKISKIPDVKPNRIYEIYESSATAPIDSTLISQHRPQPIFEDVSDLLNHEHHEDPFDDFRRQPLLPNRLSTLGPGLAWHDFDNDGDDDLTIAAGKGGQLALFRNHGKDGFRQINEPRFTRATESDQTSVVGWTKSDGSTTLLVGKSNFEKQNGGDSEVLKLDLRDGQLLSSTTVCSLEASVGPMAMADYDSDGDLDLLVAGRTKPGRYPESASARLYRNDNGTLHYDSENSQPFQQIGLISAAVFSDLDADGDADLVLAIEWGPVTVFLNDNGHFSNATQKLGLDRYHGRWNGVTTGDLDEDGKLDIIATNWGLNTKYEHRYDDDHPLQIFYDDFDNNGYFDVVEAYFDPETQALFPERNLLSLAGGLPYIRFRMPNNDKYSRSTLHEIIGPKLSQAKKLKANTLAHTVFFNRDGSFEAVPLPKEAQFSIAFSVAVSDFDGDGHEDVFVSQNFFGMQVGVPRADGGRGLWLKGDGSGKLSAVPAQNSGIQVYGEQRGAALSDYDGDGRIDVVVSQNAASTKLYRNVGGRPGLRVRLAGPKENPAGVGAALRLIYDGKYGPAREIHAGSGYWSQNSLVQVLGVRDGVTGIWVRWPGGHISKQDISPGQREVTVQFDGTL